MVSFSKNSTWFISIFLLQPSSQLIGIRSHPCQVLGAHGARKFQDNNHLPPLSQLPSLPLRSYPHVLHGRNYDELSPTRAIVMIFTATSPHKSTRAVQNPSLHSKYLLRKFYHYRYHTNFPVLLPVFSPVMFTLRRPHWGHPRSPDHL